MNHILSPAVALIVLKWNEIQVRSFSINLFLLNNFSEGLKKIKNLLSDWSFRNLSVNGKIVAIKTLALPILVQYFVSLEDPPDNVFHEFLNFFGMENQIKSKEMS